MMMMMMKVQYMKICKKNPPKNKEKNKKKNKEKNNFQINKNFLQMDEASDAMLLKDLWLIYFPQTK